MKGIRAHNTTWINLKDIMQRAISQSQKDKYYLIPLISGTQSGQIHRDRK